MKNKYRAKYERVLLADLVDIESPPVVLREVTGILTMVYPGFDHTRVIKVHNDVVDLFTGQYPGYRECNTGYHDLRHTMDVFLAMARLIHGVHIGGYTMSRKNMSLGLVSALLHDTGYIQASGDNHGSGGKYTLVHVKRSQEFMRRYFAGNEFSMDDIRKCHDLIECTSLTAKIGKIPFHDEEIRMLGKMHFAADLLGQMSDRIYLEKLHLLYEEFAEGQVTEFRDERDLLEKTIGFYNMIIQRLSSELSDIDRYMRNHFRVRWDLDRDMYSEAVENNINYLKHILKEHGDDYRSKLKRGQLLNERESG